MRRKGRCGTGSGETDIDSDVGKETKWDGLPNDIASDGGDGWITIDNGNFLVDVDVDSLREIDGIGGPPQTVIKSLEPKKRKSPVGTPAPGRTQQKDWPTWGSNPRPSRY